MLVVVVEDAMVMFRMVMTPVANTMLMMSMSFEPGPNEATMLMGGLFGRFAGSLCGDLGLSASVSGQALVLPVAASVIMKTFSRPCRRGRRHRR